MVPGGSACNTIIGIGKLGGQCRFIGKCGKDPLGELIIADLENNGVEPILALSPSPTGSVLSIVTPDAQRTMFTFLGAASEITLEEIPETCFENAAIVHIEGYLLHNRELMIAALQRAKEARATVSLDLASFTIVEESKEFLKDIVNTYVHILIANEDEARVFTGQTDEKAAINMLSKMAPLAVLKIGERGSYISQNGKAIRIQPMESQGIKDTTGAGDLWASGFLFGLVSGYSLEKCGQLGSACGYEVCQIIGANILDDGWQRIRQLL
jgi:sugar/nucleoside kinase (ribokinase family)